MYRVYISPPTEDYPKYNVSVHELKFDNIRQEKYWVLTHFKVYRLREHAETFAKRFGWVKPE